MQVTSTADDQELARLFEEVRPRLWRSLYAFARDREVATDAVSEAFAQYLVRRGEVRSPEAWVWRAAFRIAAGELKRRGSTSFVPAPEAVAEDRETNELLGALDQLTPRQRAVTVLRYYVGYRPAEIAEILGTSASTVRVHLLRARRRLLPLLEDHDED